VLARALRAARPALCGTLVVAAIGCAHRQQARREIVHSGARTEPEWVCFRTDRPAGAFPTGDGEQLPDLRAYQSLSVLLNNTEMHRDSLLFMPVGAINIRGRGNHFGDHVAIDPDPAYDPDQVTSDLQLRRGRAHQRVAPWVKGIHTPGDIVRNGDSPERVYECIEIGLSGGDGPSGTASWIADGAVWRYVRDEADYELRSGTLTISWNSDWVILDEPSLTRIYAIHLRTRTGAYSNRAMGATIHLYAVNGFILVSSLVAGGIQLAGGSKYFTADQVATLRYTSRDDAWVLA
jgi:hypothetical protein